MRGSVPRSAIFSVAIFSVVFAGGLWACGEGPLSPATEVDGLRFSASAELQLIGPAFGGDPDAFALVGVRARNVSPFPIQRTYDGGCFIRRTQAYLISGGDRRLAYDSDLDPNRACTDDLAILDLAPGEEAEPPGWHTAVRFAEVGDSFPAGRYEIVIRIQAGDRTLRAGVVEVQ